MKKFEPSEDFVATVMKDVRAYEKNRNAMRPPVYGLLSSVTFRYAISAGGALLGIINLIKLYYPVFSPVVCR